MYAFIPKRLEIEDRPEMNNFSLNILIWEVMGNVHSHYLYEPDFSTYKLDGDNQYLLYRGNQQDKVELENALTATASDLTYMVNELKNPKTRQISICYNRQINAWYGVAFSGGKVLGRAHGGDWRTFFLHLAGIFDRD